MRTTANLGFLWAFKVGRVDKTLDWWLIRRNNVSHGTVATSHAHSAVCSRLTGLSANIIANSNERNINFIFWNSFFFSYFNFYLKTSKKLVYVPFKIFDIQRLFFVFFFLKPSAKGCQPLRKFAQISFFTSRMSQFYWVNSSKQVQIIIKKRRLNGAITKVREATLI